MKLKGENISIRFIDLAVETMKLIRKFPDNYTSIHIGKQLLRSSTSCGANYEEAGAVESNADFVHKLKISLKEIREAIYWLKILARSDIVRTTPIAKYIDEFSELSNIIAKSIITVQKKAKNKF